MVGVWVVERWSVLLRAWIPVSAVGAHYTMNKAKLASRALSRAFTRVRVRNLDGGEVYTVRGVDSGRYWGSLLLAVIIFLLMGVI